MFDLHSDAEELSIVLPPTTGTRHVVKRVFDVCVSVILLIPLVFIAFCLLFLNPIFNAGPMVFRQKRMGRNCDAFMAFKFRSMCAGAGHERGAFDALDVDRVTLLGCFMRKTRIDELPQIINVLRGEMSLIGPRPDSFGHACVYLREIPGYAQRHSVRPGISGFAQVEIGYVDGYAGVIRKVEADLHYLRHASFGFDMWIAWRTLWVVVGRKGS